MALAAALTSTALSAAALAATQACRVDGIANEVQCGSIQRSLDPAKPDGTRIDIHFIVVPALARNKQPDAVLMLAGGPGQSAIGVAPAMLPALARLNYRRDLVFIDQRGTGKSALLQCPDDAKLPLAEQLDTAAQLRRLSQCREALGKLPYGDLRMFTTTVAMQDFEAVRQHLGVLQWNLVGASYGTRAALEYQRQFPAQVRRTVLDGVAPPDMVLPASASADSQDALDAMFTACEQEPLCARQYPALRSQWATLLQNLPKPVSALHPSTGVPERITLTRALLLRRVRAPLYVPALASALPAAIAAASQDRFEGLLGLGSALGGNKAGRVAMGMHLSVVCAEDMPRLSKFTDQPGASFGRDEATYYQAMCQDWPRGSVPEAFYTVPPAQSPVLLLSGGADPATPPRHGTRTAQSLGASNAALVQHLVVPHAGHGIATLGCMGDVVFKFIDANTNATALPQDASCALRIPRPSVFRPSGANSAAATEATKATP